MRLKLFTIALAIALGLATRRVLEAKRAEL